MEHHATLIKPLLVARSATAASTASTCDLRIEALVRRLGLYGEPDPTPTQLADDADESSLKKITCREDHVLQPLLVEVNNYRSGLHNKRKSHFN